MKRLAVAGSRTQDTSGLSRQCSATELRQLDNHQPLQSSICTAQVVLKCLSRTPGSHSVCGIRTPSGVDRKILSIRKEPMLSGFSHSKCSDHCEGWWLYSYRGSVAEHWWLKPEVSWVRLPATASLFNFLYFRLITSKFLYFQREARCSEHLE